jgi:hypothetical protein
LRTNKSSWTCFWTFSLNFFFSVLGLFIFFLLLRVQKHFLQLRTNTLHRESVSLRFRTPLLECYSDPAFGWKLNLMALSWLRMEIWGLEQVLPFSVSQFSKEWCMTVEPLRTSLALTSYMLWIIFCNLCITGTLSGLILTCIKVIVSVPTELHGPSVLSPLHPDSLLGHFLLHSPC